MRLSLTTILLALTFFYQSCAPFKPLPKTVKESSEIIGTYSNDCDSTIENNISKYKLWKHIDKKYEGREDSLFVKIEITKDKKLKAKLINGDKVVAEKIIKGQFRSDQCYYRPRCFYIVPILPVLWWFNNEQMRIYFTDNQLVFEETYNTAGAVIITAGGRQGNLKWFYYKLPR